LADLIPEYVEYLRDERQLAAQTIHAYKHDARHFALRFNQPIETVTRDDLRLYMRELKVAGYAPATIRRTFHGFGTLWAWLYVEHYVSDIATHNLILPRKNQATPRWFSKDEMAAFIEPCYSSDQEPRLRAAWLFLARTGVRPSELRGLMVRDVNRSEWLVTVRNTKSRIDRSLPIVDVFLQDLMAEVIEGRAGDDFVFSGAFGNKWDRLRMRMSFRRHIRIAGLFKPGDVITPYVLRHSVGTHLAINGVPIHVIKEWMGHKSITTTMIYLHAAPMDLRTAALKLFA
jgi:site-specific recombinase XerD